MSESKLEHAYLNPLQLNISMHNLQPVLYMSPMLLTTKIYWIIIGDLFLYWYYIKIWFSSDTVRGLKGYFHNFWLLKKKPTDWRRLKELQNQLNWLESF